MSQEETNVLQNNIADPTITNQPETQEAESVEQVNWREFRKKREEELKRTREIEERAAAKAAEAEALKAALDAVLNKNQNQTNDEQDDEEKRIERKIEERFRRKAEEEERVRRERETAEMPLRIRQMHSDFDNVCTQENMDYLEFHYPEVAAGLQYMPNGIDKWTNVYKAIKRFIPNIDSKKEQKKIEQNLSKPQSMSVGGMTSTGDSAPRMLDEQKKEANWRRMQRAMRGTL